MVQELEEVKSTQLTTSQVILRVLLEYSPIFFFLSILYSTFKKWAQGSTIGYRPKFRLEVYRKDPHIYKVGFITQERSCPWWVGFSVNCFRSPILL
jgi:hypothetical protein